MQRVAPADLQRHDRLEVAADVLLHGAHRPGRDRRVGEPLVAHERRAHRRDHRDVRVVGQVVGIDERDARAVPQEAADREVRVIRVPAPARAEDPRAGGERLEVVFEKGTGGEHRAYGLGATATSEERDDRSAPEGAASDRSA